MNEFNAFEEIMDGLSHEDYSMMLDELLKINLNLKFIAPIHAKTGEYLRIDDDGVILPLFTNLSNYEKYIKKFNYKNIKSKKITISQLGPKDNIFYCNINPLDENIELAIPPLLLVNQLSQLDNIVTNMDPEIYDIELEKLSDKYNINGQLLNIELKDKKLDDKFIEENVDLIGESIFITPLWQISENEYQLFGAENKDPTPLFTNEENYNTWKNNNPIDDKYEAYLISMTLYLETIGTENITIINPDTDDVTLGKKEYGMIYYHDLEDDDEEEYDFTDLLNENVNKTDFNPKEGYDIKIRLDGYRPLTWRDLIIPAGITFEELHMMIQVLMGFDNYHMYLFEIGNKRIGNSNYLDDAIDSKHTLIDKYFNKNKKIQYTYDFGDSWQFTIEIKKKVDIDTHYPKLKRFKGDYNPVEDCGGVWGLEELVELKENDIDEDELDEFDMDTLNELEKFDLKTKQQELKDYMDHRFRS